MELYRYEEAVTKIEPRLGLKLDQDEAALVHSIFRIASSKYVIDLTATDREKCRELEHKMAKLLDT